MKRIIFYASIVLLIGLGFFLFFKAKQMRILPSQAEIGQANNSNSLSSLRETVSLSSQPIENPSAEESLPPEPQPTAERNPFKSTEAPVASSFSFAIIGDTQNFTADNPNGNFQKAVNLIAKKNPDLVIATGDLVSTSENYTNYSEKFAEWKKIMTPLLSKTYATMGNHDNIDQKGDNAWQEAFNFPTNGPTKYSETVYSFDFKNSHFVFLNSDKEKEHLVDNSQRVWLEQDLAKNQKENVFVVFHEPAFPISHKIGEGLDADPSERNAFWKILDQYNITAVINGHEHLTSRRKIDGLVSSAAKNSIYQFIFGNTDSFDHNMPAGGIAEYANQTQGSFGIFKIKGKEITVEIHESDGKILDTFTFSK